VRRTLWQRCMFKKVYRCRACGQHAYALRFSQFWLRDRLKGSRITLGRVPNLGSRVTDALGVPETLPNLKTARLQLGHFSRT